MVHHIMEISKKDVDMERVLGLPTVLLNQIYTKGNIRTIQNQAKVNTTGQMALPILEHSPMTRSKYLFM